MKIRFTILLLLIVLFVGCHRYSKEIPTGAPMSFNNVYASPTYNHSKVMNLLILPINNVFQINELEAHRKEITLAVLRNFGKFHYFNLQYDRDFSKKSDAVVDLETGKVDRVKLGAIGGEYRADAVFQMSISETQVFPPMRMNVKAAIIDTQTAEIIWAFDHVYDTDDANIVNAMRVWWNSRIAGGSYKNRFDQATVRPSLFFNFVFYTMARTYSKARVENSVVVEQEEMALQKVEQSSRRLKQKDYEESFMK